MWIEKESEAYGLHLHLRKIYFSDRLNGLLTYNCVAEMLEWKDFQSRYVEFSVVGALVCRLFGLDNGDLIA